MSEIDDVSARRAARLNLLDALLREILNHLDGRQQQDVPLHQRGFGVMDEPPE
jgi:hypothetical protein